jgi:hypothetical protein
MVDGFIAEPRCARGALRSGPEPRTMSAVNDPKKRALVIGVALLAVVAGVVIASRGHKTPVAVQPTQSATPFTGPTCLPTPARAATPAWYPKDLPLPAGSFATSMKAGSPVPGYDQTVFTVPVTLQNFIKYALSAWPAHGWSLGTGDSEPGEAEDTFAKRGTKRYGAFRANSYLCDKSSILLYIIVGREAPPTPTPTGTVHAPLRSP